MSAGQTGKASADEQGLEWLDVEPARGGGVRSVELLRRLLVGRARPTRELEETLLSKFLALPIFASDAISSVA